MSSIHFIRSSNIQWSVGCYVVSIMCCWKCSTSHVSSTCPINRVRWSQASQSYFFITQSWAAGISKNRTHGSTRRCFCGTDNKNIFTVNNDSIATIVWLRATHSYPYKRRYQSRDDRSFSWTSAQCRSTFLLLLFSAKKSLYRNFNMRLGATIPNFSAETTQGPIKFYEWLGDSYVLIYIFYDMNTDSN